MRRRAYHFVGGPRDDTDCELIREVGDDGHIELDTLTTFAVHIYRSPEPVAESDREVILHHQPNRVRRWFPPPSC